MHEGAHAERVTIDFAKRFGSFHRGEGERVGRLLGAARVTRLQHVSLGEPGVSTTKIRIARDRLLEQLDRVRQVLGTALPHSMVRAQEQRVGVDVLGQRGGEAHTRRQGVYETSGNGGRELVLHLEDVGHATVVAFRPLRLARVRVEQLRADAQPIAVALHAALQHRAGVELAADVANVFAAVPKAEARRLRNHTNPGNAAERVHDLFGQPVAEELVIRWIRRIYEGENGDPHAIERGGRCPSRKQQNGRRRHDDQRQRDQQPAQYRAVTEHVGRRAYLPAPRAYPRTRGALRSVRASSRLHCCDRRSIGNAHRSPSW